MSMGFLSYCIIIYDKNRFIFITHQMFYYYFIILKGRTSKKIRDAYGKGGTPKELGKGRDSKGTLESEGRLRKGREGS